MEPRRRSCRSPCRTCATIIGDDLVLIADLCVDEYTDHGHCGVLDDDGQVDNDATLELYAQVAVAQADGRGRHRRAVAG